MKNLSFYTPLRLYSVFAFLLTIYLVIKKRKSLLGMKPLSPILLKETITYLGASFIKLAQVLATRSDFFDKEYLDELKELHDQLPAMSDKDFDEVFNRAFDENSFASFEIVPIACASIGQVHVAYTHEGKKVAVKLRRLSIEAQVKADIKIISAFNALFRPLFSHYTKNSIEAVIGEFSKMILQEVSLTHELNNLIKFSSVYKDSGIKFPKPFVELCCDDALVMSFMEGFRFDDKESLLKYDIDFRAIISKLVDFYTTQMLIKGYFHADPHPGNLLVSKEAELILLDFGMLKSVPNSSRVAIIELIKAANEKDYESYIAANKKLGTIAYEAPTAELAEFSEKMFEIFSNDNLNSESMQQLAFDVLESTRNLPFKLPSDAIYILRVSAIIEGLGTTYIENFNGVKDILPILQKNIPKALGAKESIIETLIDEIKDIPFLAKNFKSAIKKISSNELHVEISNDQLGWIKKDLKEAVKFYALSFVMMLGSIFLLLLDKDYKSAALILFVLGALRIFYR
ncbi:ABC-1 [Sulfurimonas denitrificans DSM 1251]|uniref:ABC-1 n=1 Tax=Sulfurimonas denitrificans (strain ATCC 33889 / DSM 1251) TaxID=326298 RepID=Q30S21_SULDN|nr:AarF/UbiB family protein [Sulfurimonas denitrificans]ABB44210.1 ABC-1 [Sulfurimonas denitrificans DSM 1251]